MHEHIYSSLMLFSDEDLKDDLAGSTANVVLIKENKMYCVSADLFFLTETNTSVYLMAVFDKVTVAQQCDCDMLV